MNTHYASAKINRVLIMVDAAPQCLAVFETAGKLAARMGIDLTGVFVEENDLLNTAALPLTQIVDRISGNPRNLDSDSLQRSLRAQAEGVRRTLDRIAQAQNIRCDLRIVQGRYWNEALSLLAERDILFLCRGPGNSEPRRSVRPTSFPVWVILDDLAGITQMLPVAAQMAESSGRSLNILVPEDCSPELLQQISVLLVSQAVPYAVARLHALNSQQIEAAISRAGCSLLVLSDSFARQFNQEEQRELLQKMPCPLVLVS